MKITETTPTAPPPPRTFTVVMSYAELKAVADIMGANSASDDRKAGVDPDLSWRLFSGFRDAQEGKLG